MSTETVYSKLREILCNNAPSVQHQVGYLTGINRDKWAGLSADAVLIGRFAPVTPDGYGIGYSVQDDWMGTQVSTYDTRDGEAFVNSVETVFNDLFDVFNGTNFK